MWIKKIKRELKKIKGENIKKNVLKINNMQDLTQHEKILKIMLNHLDIVWWFPYDFMKPELGKFFVGYEASARFSKLAKNYPKMIESERDGKYIKRRLRVEAVEEFYPTLTDRMKCMIWDAGLKTMDQSQMF